MFPTPLKEDGEDSFRREFHQTFQMKERDKRDGEKARERQRKIGREKERGK